MTWWCCSSSPAPAARPRGGGGRNRGEHPLEEGDQSDAADQDDGQVVCHPEVAPPPLTLSIESLEDGPVDRSPRESLSLTITSAIGDDLLVTITARTLSSLANAEREVTEVEVPAGETTIVDLAVADLGLPDGALETSANLLIAANPRRATGEAFASSDLPIYYHPRDGGFVFYDEASRVRDFDSGALTEGARQRRAEVEAADHADNVVVIDTGELFMQAASEGEQEGGR